MGSDKESRELYRDVVKRHQKVLIDVEANPERAGEVYQAFLRETTDRYRVATGGVITAPNIGVDMSEVMLFLFLGGDANCRKGVGNLNATYTYSNVFINSAHLPQKLATENGSPIVKKLFAAWLGEEEQITLLNRGFRMAAQYDVKECLGAAMKTGSKTGLNAIYRSYALTALAKLGTKDLLEDADFQKLMKDKAAIRVGVNVTEIRDIALGVAVELSGQKMSDYGFERARPNGLTAPMSYIYYSFGSDEKRDAAHKKWAEWVESHKKK